MQAAAYPRHRAEFALELAGCPRQLVAHRHETPQRTAIDYATAFPPGHDHLVADVTEHLAAVVIDGNGKKPERAVEKAMNADAAKPLGEPRRSRDIDKQHEAVFLYRGMIAPGDEVQEGARSDDVGDREAQVHHDREDGGIDEAGPENLAGHSKGKSGNSFTQFQALDKHDNRRIDRA